MMGKPKIRFKGYNEDWEQRKLKDILVRRVEQRKQSEEYPRLAFASGQGVIPLSERKTNNREQLTKDEFTKKYLVTELDDIVYNPANVKYGAIDRNKCGRGLISPIYVTFTTSEIPGFIERIVTSHDFQQRALRFEEGTVTKRQSVNPEDFVTIDILVATQKEEQSKISEYFDRLDHLITLHHRECVILRKMKVNDWEQRKLGDLVNRVSRKNQDLVSELPLTISAQYGLIDQNEFFNKRVASKDVSGYYLIENGEFAYNKSTSTDAPWGTIKRLDRYENGVLSTLYIVFGIKENNPVDSDFLVSYYSTNLWHKGIHEIAAEGARNHGLLNISPMDFFETKLMIPQGIEEQKKIGKYFEELERLITLHHRECVILRKMKVNDWEQRKLGEIAEYRNGKAHENEIDDDGEYIVVNSKFVSTNGKIKKFSNAQNEPLYENEIAFVLSDVPNGRAIARTFLVDKSGKYTLNQRIAGITPHEDTDPYYLYIKMNRNAYFLKFDDGNKQTNLSIKDVLNYEDMYPSYEEQQKIGTYFDTIDHLITLHQHKCDELQNLKKYMLQNMFV